MRYSPYKLCTACERVMSADDAHRKCQKCRNGGQWRKWAGYNDWQKQARAEGRR